MAPIVLQLVCLGFIFLSVGSSRLDSRESINDHLKVSVFGHGFRLYLEICLVPSGAGVTILVADFHIEVVDVIMHTCAGGLDTRSSCLNKRKMI